MGNGGISPFSLELLENSCLSWVLEQEVAPGYIVNWDSVTVTAPKGKPPAGGGATYPPTDAWGRVDHVDSGGAGEDLPVADGVRYVDVALDAALLELHVVLREGAGLVREDVLHLRTQGWLGGAALTQEALQNQGSFPFLWM